MVSTTKFIANKEAWQDEWKIKKLENLAMLLKGALVAEAKVGLKINVSEENIKGLLEILPSMKAPTMTPLHDAGWHAVETIIDEDVVRDLIPELKRAGACDIIEYPLNKVIP